MHKNHHRRFQRSGDGSSSGTERSTVPLWLPVIGNVFAILFVKQLFGGLGQNFMNPALAGRCFLLISFAGRMTDFTWDGVSSATPLAARRQENLYRFWICFLERRREPSARLL